MRIAAELRRVANFREGAAKITEEPVGDRSVVSHGRELQSQRKGLDLRFEKLFKTPSSQWIHGIGGDGRRDRLATARAYSRQTSAGASWT